MKASYGEASGFSFVKAEELTMVNGGKGESGGGSGNSGSGDSGSGSGNEGSNNDYYSGIGIPLHNPTSMLNNSGNTSNSGSTSNTGSQGIKITGLELGPILIPTGFQLTDGNFTFGVNVVAFQTPPLIPAMQGTTTFGVKVGAGWRF